MKQTGNIIPISRNTYTYISVCKSANMFRSDEEDIRGITEILREVNLSEEQEETLDTIFTRMEKKKRNATKISVVTVTMGLAAILIGMFRDPGLTVYGMAWLMAGILVWFYYDTRYAVIEKFHMWVLICMVSRGLNAEEER